jgi:hypothetical protein
MTIPIVTGVARRRSAIRNGRKVTYEPYSRMKITVLATNRPNTRLLDGFGNAQAERDCGGRWSRHDSQRERGVPGECGQRPPDGRIHRGADAEHAGVVAHGGGSLPALVEVADEGHVERAQRRGADALEKPECDQERERSRERAGNAGDGEQQQRRDKHPSPTGAVGEHAQHRGQDHSRQGEHGDQQGDVRGRDVEGGGDLGQCRCQAGDAQDRGQRDAGDDPKLRAPKGGCRASRRRRLCRHVQRIPGSVAPPTRSTIVIVVDHRPTGAGRQSDRLAKPWGRGDLRACPHPPVAGRWQLAYRVMPACESRPSPRRPFAAPHLRVTCRLRCRGQRAVVSS